MRPGAELRYKDTLHDLMRKLSIAEDELVLDDFTPGYYFGAASYAISAQGYEAVIFRGLSVWLTVAGSTSFFGVRGRTVPGLPYPIAIGNPALPVNTLVEYDDCFWFDLPGEIIVPGFAGLMVMPHLTLVKRANSAEKCSLDALQPQMAVKIDPTPDRAPNDPGGLAYPLPFETVRVPDTFLNPPNH